MNTKEFSDKLHESVVKHLFWEINNSLTELCDKFNDLEACIKDDLEEKVESYGFNTIGSKNGLKIENIETRLEKLEKMHLDIADL
jgi:hypothetical protein